MNWYDLPLADSERKEICILEEQSSTDNRVQHWSFQHHFICATLHVLNLLTLCLRWGD